MEEVEAAEAPAAAEEALVVLEPVAEDLEAEVVDPAP